MSIPHDPSTKKTQRPARVMSPQAPGVCGLCLGAGQYLEPLCGDPTGELLRVQCACCEGTGQRPSA
jgi:hypothetical protein